MENRPYGLSGKVGGDNMMNSIGTAGIVFDAQAVFVEVQGVLAEDAVHEKTARFLILSANCKAV